MSMGGGSSGGGTTVQKTEPWDKAKPYYERLYNTAENAYNAVDKTPYSGQLVAEQSTPTLAAQSDLLNLVPTLQNNANTVQNYANDVASGKYLNSSTNTALQDTIDSTRKSMAKSYAEDIVPTITSNAIQSGAYGGAGHGIALAKSADSLEKNMADEIAKINYQNYATERNYQNALPTLMSTANSLLTTPASIESGVGSSMEGYQQSLLDAALSQFNANQLAPYTGLDIYANLLNGSSSGYGTSTGQVNSAKGSTVGNALMGTLGGGALGYGAASLIPALGMTGPVGLGIGAGLGLLGGLFG